MDQYKQSTSGDENVVVTLVDTVLDEVDDPSVEDEATRAVSGRPSPWKGFTLKPDMGWKRKGQIMNQEKMSEEELQRILQTMDSEISSALETHCHTLCDLISGALLHAYALEPPQGRVPRDLLLLEEYHVVEELDRLTDYPEQEEDRSIVVITDATNVCLQALMMQLDAKMRRWWRQNAGAAGESFGKAPFQITDVLFLTPEEQATFVTAVTALLCDQILEVPGDEGMDSLQFELLMRLAPCELRESKVATEDGQCNAVGSADSIIVRTTALEAVNAAQNGVETVGDIGKRGEKNSGNGDREDLLSNHVGVDHEADDDASSDRERVRKILSTFAGWVLDRTIQQLSEWQGLPEAYHVALPVVNFTAMWCAVHKRMSQLKLDRTPALKRTIRNQMQALSHWRPAELVAYMGIAVEVQEAHLADFVKAIIRETDFGWCGATHNLQDLEHDEIPVDPIAVRHLLSTEYSCLGLNYKLMEAFSEHQRHICSAAQDVVPTKGAFSSLGCVELASIPAAESAKALVLADILSEAVSLKLASILITPFDIVDAKALARPVQLQSPVVHHEKSPEDKAGRAKTLAMLGKRFGNQFSALGTKSPKSPGGAVKPLKDSIPVSETATVEPTTGGKSGAVPLLPGSPEQSI